MKFGQYWSILVNFGLFLVHFSQIWSIMINFGQFWPWYFHLYPSWKSQRKLILIFHWKTCYSPVFTGQWRISQNWLPWATRVNISCLSGNCRWKQQDFGNWKRTVSRKLDYSSFNPVGRFSAARCEKYLGDSICDGNDSFLCNGHFNGDQANRLTANESLPDEPS